MNPAILQIDGWMHEQELNWLYHTAQKAPVGSLIVEIGAWKGRSSAALCEGAGNTKTVLSIDTWKGQEDLLDSDHKEALTTDLFFVYMENMRQVGFVPVPYGVSQGGPMYILADSTEAINSLRDGTVALAFIDGDHRKTGADIDAIMPKMAKDGIISGHDYFCFFEDVQVEIHKRFFIHELHYSIWVRFLGEGPPGWYK